MKRGVDEEQLEYGGVRVHEEAQQLPQLERDVVLRVGVARVTDSTVGDCTFTADIADAVTEDAAAELDLLRASAEPEVPNLRAHDHTLHVEVGAFAREPVRLAPVHGLVDRRDRVHGGAA